MYPSTSPLTLGEEATHSPAAAPNIFNSVVCDKVKQSS